jgi:hypothetical protein
MQRHHGNIVERTWRDLKRHHLDHCTFKGAAHLICAIHAAVSNSTRNVKRRIRSTS